jgi:hypothetical protein
MLAQDEVFLRIWTPSFAHLDLEVPVELTVKKVPRFSNAQIRREEPQPIDASERHSTLNLPITFLDKCAYERVYAFPADLILEPQKEYSISGQVSDEKKNIRIFEFTFRTDSRGLPVAY